MLLCLFGECHRGKGKTNMLYYLAIKTGAEFNTYTGKSLKRTPKLKGKTGEYKNFLCGGRRQDHNKLEKQTGLGECNRCHNGEHGGWTNECFENTNERNT